MLSLCFDIHGEISKFLCITDLRNLSRTCTLFNKIYGSKIENTEKYYFNKYNNMKFMAHFYDYCIEKFTVEIILDGYYHLLSDKYYASNNTIICAMLAFTGKLDLLEYAIEKSCPLDVYMSKCASYNGHVQILTFLHNKNVNLICQSGVTYNATLMEQIKVFEWLKKHYYNAINSFVQYSVLIGSVKMLQYHLNNGCAFDDKISKWAVERNNLNILQFLLDNKLYIDKHLYVFATQYERLHILSWLKVNGFVMVYETIIREAIINKHTNILDWCLENNIEININVNICQCSVLWWSIDVLNWAHKHGYEFDNNIWITVINGSHMNTKSLDILQWAIDKNLITYDTIYNYAENGNNKYVIEWILKKM